ncbi:MAG: hypothetical protein IH891_03110 [Planctomycetes bacterium]|nr:hypothetical protein [Planctomycetota bacterium]
MIGLLAVVGGVCGIWYSGLNQPGLTEELPPLPNQDEVVPELFLLVNQARNEVIRDPRNAGLWLTLALIYDSNMDFGKARQCYEQSITLHPDCGFAPGSASDIPIDEAYLKLRSEAQAAEMLREEYG